MNSITEIACDGSIVNPFIRPGTSSTDCPTQSTAGGRVLEAIYTPEGRITPIAGTNNYQYEYVFKDHLGDARLTFADLNGNGLVDVPGDILQENHYYPFGMNAVYGWMNNVALLDNRYQYNGKELKDAVGLLPDFHGKVMGNGNYVHPHTGEVLGNLYDYIH